MNLKLNPKLLDVVELDAAVSGGAKRQGTVVEAFGEPPSAVLIEISDSQGVPQEYVTRDIGEVKPIWTASGSKPEPAVTEAQQRFGKGFLLLQNGLIAKAKVEFSQAFSLNKELRAILLNAATDLAARGNFDAAIVVYGLIVQLQPDYQLARLNLAATHVQRGIKLGRAGFLSQAVEDFKKALMLRPNEESVGLIRKNLVAAYTRLAVRYSDEQEYTESIKYFLIAFELDPSDVTQRNLAIAMVASSAAKSEVEAPIPERDSFAEPIQMGLTFSECLNAYGATLARRGRISKARLSLRKAVETDPQNELAKKNLETLSQEEAPEVLPIGLLSLEPEELPLRN